jgi:hypothetical protein
MYSPKSNVIEEKTMGFANISELIIVTKIDLKGK